MVVVVRTLDYDNDNDNDNRKDSGSTGLAAADAPCSGVGWIII